MLCFLLHFLELLFNDFYQNNAHIDPLKKQQQQPEGCFKLILLVPDLFFFCWYPPRIKLEVNVVHSVFAVHAVVSNEDNEKSIMFNKCRWQHKFQHAGCFQAIHFLCSYESGNGMFCVLMEKGLT